MIGRDVDLAPESAFSVFFEDRYLATLRGAYLLTGSRSAAEDVAQDAFRAVWERWGDLTNPGGYLWQALTNRARSLGRVERRPPRLPMIDHADDADADTVAVRELLEHLPQAQREAIVLRYYLGLRDPEIAEAMNCPLGTAKSHVRRGLESMRRALR